MVLKIYLNPSLVGCYSTTVGYGGSSRTIFGKFLASIIMILGYGIIAVPTGIVSAAIVKSTSKVTTQSCRFCSKEGHD